LPETGSRTGYSASKRSNEVTHRVFFSANKNLRLAVKRRQLTPWTAKNIITFSVVSQKRDTCSVGLVIDVAAYGPQFCPFRISFLYQFSP